MSRETPTSLAPPSPTHVHVPWPASILVLSVCLLAWRVAKLDCECEPTGTRPSTRRAMPKSNSRQVKAADTRIAASTAELLASVRSCAAEKSNIPPLCESNIEQLSADAALDLFSQLTLSGDLHDEDTKDMCVSCLERCDDIWSDSNDEDLPLPHQRALFALGAAMCLGTTIGLAASKATRKLFVYACMLLSAVLGSIAEEQSEGTDPSGVVADLIDATEAALDGGATLFQLVAAGLSALNEEAVPSAQVAVPVLRALETLIRSLHEPRCDDQGQGRACLPLPRAQALLDTDALSVAIATAALHAESKDVHAPVIGILQAAAGDDPAQRLSVDTLVSRGGLSTVVRTLRTFPQEAALMAQACLVLDFLTSTERGRLAAREADAAAALDGVIEACTKRQNAEERQDEALLDVNNLRVLRAVLASAELADVLQELAPGAQFPVEVSFSKFAQGAQQGFAPQQAAASTTTTRSGAAPPIAHTWGKEGDLAWYWY